MGYVYSDVEKLRFTKKNVITLVVLFILGAAAVTGYGIYSYNNTSVSASYSAETRLEKNTAMARYVLKEHPELEDKKIVTIVESGMRKVFEPELTYTVAVYQLNEEEFAKEQAEDPALTLLKRFRGFPRARRRSRRRYESLAASRPSWSIKRRTNSFPTKIIWRSKKTESGCESIRTFLLH